jgi:hypothetical protein
MGKLTRRQLGLGIGASLLAAPFLDFLERPARAGGGTAKRLVIMFSPNGTIPAHWTPSGSGTSFSFPTGSILEPLGTTTVDPVLGTLPSVQSDLIVCGGLNFVNTSNHYPGTLAMLTGNGDATSPSGGMSVDQYIAAAIGTKTKFQSLQFGVQTSLGANAQTAMSYSAPKVPVPSADDPLAAFNRMFGALVGDPQAAALLLKKQNGVLNLAMSELKALRARVGAEEQAKLDAHLNAIEQVQSSLSTPTTCGAPTPPTSANYATNDNFPVLGKAQMDLLVTALSCGMTNVASLQWSFTVGQTSFTWLGFSDEHHSLSHSDDSDTAGVQKFVLAERWFATQFSYLVNKLKSTQDPSTPGSTLLDTTLVVWAKELADSRAHACTGVPFVLAGNANKRFQTGRFVDFKGASHTQLLVSICQAMGLTNTTFGDPTVSTGPLSGLES